jgi:hypothetical protein
MTTIVAPFHVTPRPPAEAPEGEPPSLGRWIFDKVFSGPLEATSVVEMVSVGSVEGPLAYVALERVEGSLEGRRGVFVLQHVGWMSDGRSTLELTVVPRSGTGELAGLTGRGTIAHTDAGAHLELDYALD